VYVDNVLCLSEELSKFLKQLELESLNYRLKDVGPLSWYLGATIGKFTIEGTGIQTLA
jgi:hypothetical protein